MSKKVNIQEIQPTAGGPFYGKVAETSQFQNSQLYAHSHIERIVKDLLMSGAASPLIAGFDYALSGALKVNIGAGQAVTPAGLSHDTLPLGTSHEVTLAAAHPAQPRIDLIYALLEADAPAEVALKPYVRLRTQEELAAHIPPYAPEQFNQPTESHTRAVILVRAGTPNAAPVAPSAGAGEVALFTVRVEASATVLTNDKVTDVRNRARSLNTAFSLIESINTNFSETVDDRVNALFVDSTYLTKTYDDANNLLTLDVDTSALASVLQPVSAKNQVNGYAGLDPSGKLYPEQIPPLGISSIQVVADQTARLALTNVQEGDAVKQTDTLETYLFSGGNSANNANWVLISGMTSDWSSITNKPDFATLYFSKTGNALTPSGGRLDITGGLLLTGELKWGTNATSPMLRRTGVNIEAKLADDSGYANLDVNSLYIQGFKVVAHSPNLGNTSIGQGAGFGTGSNNIFAGYFSGQNSGSGGFNVAMGSPALRKNTTGSFNTAIGFNSGNENVNGNENVYLGAYAGASNVAGYGNVFIGYTAGYYEVGNNKLYIANSNTTNPLIYGDFTTSLLKVNGKFQTTDNVGFNGTNPIAKPTVTGSKGGNAALNSLLTALAAYGLITDSTT